jgi:hypothetical protein
MTYEYKKVGATVKNRTSLMERFYIDHPGRAAATISRFWYGKEVSLNLIVLGALKKGRKRTEEIMKSSNTLYRRLAG